MTRTERFLYHQIHPLKLATDVATSFATTWLLWQAQWITAAIVAFTPSVAVTALLLWKGDLDRLRRSPLGRYLTGYMTRRVEALRFGGQAVMWLGAALHIPWLVPFGFLVITYAWLGRLWIPDSAPPGSWSNCARLDTTFGQP